MYRGGAVIEETANSDQQCFAASLMESLQSNLPKVSQHSQGSKGI